MSVSDNYVEIAGRFGSVAQEYCGIVDAAASLGTTELLRRIYRVLPEVIGEAVRLPDIQFDDGEEGDDPKVESPEGGFRGRITYDEWNKLFQMLKEKLGNADHYWTVFDPTNVEEPIYGSLADDIADIYRDLKEGLVVSEQGSAAAEDVIWRWRFGFYSHWGHHATSALRTLHNLLKDKLAGLEE